MATAGATPMVGTNIPPALADELRRARTREALRGRPSPRQQQAPRQSPLVQSVLVQSLSAETTRGQFDQSTGLSAALKAMLCDERFADVVLTVEGRRFPSHRCILAIWSGYFRTMFAGGWCESNMVEISLDQLSLVSFEAFLTYCYTGKVRVTAQHALELLHLAAFLEVAPLEDICCSVLLRSATATDLVRLLAGASTLSPRLRELCLAQLALQVADLSSNLRAAARVGAKAAAVATEELAAASEKAPEGKRIAKSSRGGWEVWEEKTDRVADRAAEKATRAAQRARELREALADLPLDCICDLLSEAAALPASAAPRALLLQLALEWADEQARATAVDEPVAAVVEMRWYEELLPLVRLPEVGAGALMDLLAARPELLHSTQLQALVRDACAYH